MTYRTDKTRKRKEERQRLINLLNFDIKQATIALYRHKQLHRATIKYPRATALIIYDY